MSDLHKLTLSCEDGRPLRCAVSLDGVPLKGVRRVELLADLANPRVVARLDMEVCLDGSVLAEITVGLTEP